MISRFIAVLFASSLAFTAHAAGPSHWVVAWGASPSPQLSNQDEMRKAKLVFADQTLRETVYSSIGGDSVRVRLSNAFGKDTVDIGAAHIALRENGGSIKPGSDQALTFGGRGSVAIPPDAVILSDPVKLTVPAGAGLAVSIYVPNQAAAAGIHYAAQQTNYIAKGNQTNAGTLTGATTITSWVFLAGVDVLAPEAAGAVVAFGDSITDGAVSTVDANHRWPDTLAARLRESGKKLAVMDAGIGGNRILHDAKSNVTFGVNALARYDRDVLAQPGVRYVIVLEGINDIGHAGTSAPITETVSAEDIIAGLRQLIERAHERGLKIYGGTLTPFEGTVFPGYYSPEKDVKRKAVNDWIRTGKAFDGVIDFDKAVQDPQNPNRILPKYDGGDRLHPGDAGYKAMGEAIDLSLFR
jgi:lysophospholipase L1-like esterase